MKTLRRHIGKCFITLIRKAISNKTEVANNTKEKNDKYDYKQ
jgi:hypothetical protein